ncbi:MAG TPA: agmatine deiminase family protein [Oligoflexus sp.]|uniref:agmatine deiminase family protein n=1 Tax=Oligoflexus sp. TaxID=1971216 RepID=UPI002D6E0C90|nr:agmatine deiminase family protein [Oligoflexus sp.]HYX35222.1 agmatine deiminase family protein [Oligoflexus sp.]
MNFKPISLSLLTLTLVASACGTGAKSKLDGHYEEATASNMAVYRGQQVVPAEYAKADSVIVSSELLSGYGREDLVKAILDAGAKKVWVTVNRGSGQTLQSSTFSRLRQALGTSISKVSVVEQKDSGQVTVWARDWAPLGALSDSSELRLIDFNYYPRRVADDATARSFAGLTGVERVSVPVYNEGGNFMNNNRGDCMMTTRVTDANADVFKAGDMVLDAEDIRQYYSDFAGCARTNIFPRMPTEGTGHIDMWGKFMNDDTVIVGQISERTLSLASSSNRSLTLQIQRYLDNRANDIADLGYNVVRIPMPVPNAGLFRSYTNSLLLNGTAIIPQYVRPSSGSYNDQSLVSTYEAEVRRVYQSLGYKVVFIPSDELIATGGAVHCVTMQIPAVL